MPLVLFFAADIGPKLTLEPLARRFSATVTDQLPHSSDLYRALVIGTSTSESGLETELYARAWARWSGIPIVAIEDYVGNCRFGMRDALGNEADPDYIVAESDFSRRFYVRAGFPAERVSVLPSIRYDSYRDLPPASLYRGRQASGVLWAGQPERGMGQVALGWLAPWLRRHGKKLYFRAHPRDSAYAEGLWHEWLGRHRLRWEDCTQWDWPEVWAAPLGLVATAFSSVAVDAGFRGIPTLHILHPRHVRDRLAQGRGPVRPGVVASGAAPATSNPLDHALLMRHLGAKRLRRSSRCFAQVYGGLGPIIDALETLLKDIISISQDSPAAR